VYNKRVIPLALALSLAAAVLHATWNVLLKTTGDPLRTAARAVGAAVVVTSPVAALAWLLSGRPGLPPQAWLLVGLSGFAELAYLNFLSVAYRCGDLSVVYPLARGTAPLLAVPAGLIILRERLSPLELVGVACLLVGIWAARRPVAAGPAVRPALLTGVCIATYSAIDRVGVRLAPPWLYGWVLWIAMAVLLAAWLWLGRQQAVLRVAGLRGAGWPLGAPDVSPAPDAQAAPEMDGARDWARILALGLLMMLSYFMVLLALRFAPLTLVAPLRESAIVLVTGWGIWRLKERQGLWLRLGGATSIVLGVILLAL
jgi:drug/metabolite transporter (DMT)-like permease